MDMMQAKTLIGNIYGIFNRNSPRDEILTNLEKQTIKVDFRASETILEKFRELSDLPYSFNVGKLILDTGSEWANKNMGGGGVRYKCHHCNGKGGHYVIRKSGSDSKIGFVESFSVCTNCHRGLKNRDDDKTFPNLTESKRKEIQDGSRVVPSHLTPRQHAENLCWVDKLPRFENKSLESLIATNRLPYTQTKSAPREHWQDRG